MQLVMRRYRLEKAVWYNFKINARLVIDAEQGSLLEKYRLHNVTITPGDVRRDLTKTLLITVPGSLFLTAALFGVGIGGPLVGVFILILVVSTFLVYHQIREEVRVKDLLTGRDFKARSFLDLLGKEHDIRKMSVVFANVVDQARTWQEPEVIELEPQPLFPLVEGERATP
jgi:hypothetical protein